VPLPSSKIWKLKHPSHEGDQRAIDSFYAAPVVFLSPVRTQHHLICWRDDPCPFLLGKRNIQRGQEIAGLRRNRLDGWTMIAFTRRLSLFPQSGSTVCRRLTDGRSFTFGSGAPHGGFPEGGLPLRIPVHREYRARRNVIPSRSSVCGV